LNKELRNVEKYNRNDEFIKTRMLEDAQQDRTAEGLDSIVDRRTKRKSDP